MTQQPHRIDLNEADAATLDGLPGIGPVLAARIIAYRETIHPFEEVIELTAVPGISEQMVREIEDQVEVRAPELDAPPVSEPLRVEDGDEPVVLTASPETRRAAMPAYGDGVEEDETGQRAQTMAIISPPDGRGGSNPVWVGNERVSRSGYGPASLILSSFVGGLLGVILTLGILWTINGDLNFAVAARVDHLEAQANTAYQDRLQLVNGIGVLAGRINGLSGRIDSLARQQDETGRDLAMSRQDVTTLREQAVELDGRIDNISAAAENFVVFLNGLRDLLTTLQEPPATVTITPAPTITLTVTPNSAGAPEPATGTTPAVTATPTTTATATSLPMMTRTPWPTATPLLIPTPAEE